MMFTQNSKKAGFTLIELIIILIIVGVLGAVTSRVIGETIQHRRFSATLSEMEILKTAIIGDPELVSAGVRTDFGFVGDVGRFPTSLHELVDNYNRLPSWSVTTGIGWQGPYIERGFPDDAGNYFYYRDGWGNLYGYDPATGIITSLGSDGALGGVVYAADFSTERLVSPTPGPPDPFDRRFGTLRGVVTDVLGNPLIHTAAVVDVSVRIYFPLNGVENFRDAQTDGAGVFRFPIDHALTPPGIPAGNRRLRAIVDPSPLDPPGADRVYSLLEKAVVISGVGSRHDIRVAEDVIAPRAPVIDVVHGVVGVPFSHINLSWNPPTLNTDGTSLIDLAGFNIYREVTTPFTPAPANRIATVGLVDDFTDFATETKYIYHYIIRAFDEAGNESADSITVSASIASGEDNIRKVARAMRWGTRYIVVGMRNFYAFNITVFRVRVSWMGGGPTTYSGGIGIFTRIPTDAIWVRRDNDATSNRGVAWLDSSFTLTAYGRTPANYEGILAVGFNVDIPPGTAITIELNPHLSPPTATFNVYW